MSAWASKTAPNNTQASSPANSRQTNSSSAVPSSFNATEVLEYMHRNFQKHLANANTLDDTVVYKSLESDSQWKTKPVNNKRPQKYIPKAVFRNDSNHKANSVDLLFELNRSIYQQNQTQAHQHQGQPQRKHYPKN